MNGLQNSCGPSSVRRIAVLVWLLLGLGGCATSLPLPERPDIPFGQGRIWQVDLPGLEPSYIFGTIHISDPRVFDLPAAAEAAFADASIVAFEAEHNDEVDEQEVKSFFELPPDQTLKQVVGPATYRQLNNLSFFRFYRVERLDRLQPWVVWMLIGDREITVDLRQDPNKPILDDWLQERARNDGKEVVLLETPEEQLNVFAGMPLEDQASMLRSSIDNYGGPRTRVERVNLYLEGDLAIRYALWQRFLGHMDPDVAQRFHNRIGSNRNRIMTERLMPVFARGSTFVAVGAMHLPGEDGMLRLLERQGFTVTRLH